MYILQKPLYLNILGGRFAWKWYPLAHLAAVTMSCLCAELQALQLHCCVWTPLVGLLGLCLHSCNTCTHLNFQTRDVGLRCRLQTTWNFFKDFEEGKHKLCSCTYGAGMAKSRGAGSPSYAKTADLSGSIFFLARARRSLKTWHSIHYSSSCRGKNLILGDIAMVIVKFRPRWPHTWRYALQCQLCPTMTSGSLG